METTTSDARAVNGKRHGLDLFMVAMEVCGEPEYRPGRNIAHASLRMDINNYIAWIKKLLKFY